MPATEYRVIAGPDHLINQQLPALYNTGWKPILMSTTTDSKGHHVITVMLERPPAMPAPAAAVK